MLPDCPGPACFVKFWGLEGARSRAFAQKPALKASQPGTEGEHSLPALRRVLCRMLRMLSGWPLRATMRPRRSRMDPNRSKNRRSPPFFRPELLNFGRFESLDGPQESG